MLWLLEAWKIYIIVPCLEKSGAFFGDHQCLIIPCSQGPEANEILHRTAAYYEHGVVRPRQKPFPHGRHSFVLCFYTVSFFPPQSRLKEYRAQGGSRKSEA